MQKGLIDLGIIENRIEKLLDKLNKCVAIEVLEKLLTEYTGNDYRFLTNNEHLGHRICLIGLGGSYAYGTNVETSDLDIRGIATNSAMEILTNKNFEQVVNTDTDTTIYGLNKMISLLSDCNPNTIEILGLKPEHYLYLDDVGKKLIENKHIFLSKKCINTFGGYAYAQLRRLDNKSARTLEQSEQEIHIMHSVQNAEKSFHEKFFDYPEDAIKLYVDKSEREELDSEIFMDVSLKHYPLRDYKCMWAEMHNIVKEYAKLGKRNKNAIERGKLNKHMCHLVRLYLMCFDILNSSEIVTFREKDHDLLMAIRENKDHEFLDENNQPTDRFMKLVDECQAKMDEAAKTTKLPDKPDYKAINNLLAEINRDVVEREYEVL